MRTDNALMYFSASILVRIYYTAICDACKQFVQCDSWKRDDDMWLVCVCVFGVETFRIILKRKRQLARQSFFSARSLWCRTAYKLQNITWAMKGEMKRGIYNIIFKFQATWTTKTEEKKIVHEYYFAGCFSFCSVPKEKRQRNVREFRWNIQPNWL